LAGVTLSFPRREKFAPPYDAAFRRNFFDHLFDVVVVMTTAGCEWTGVRACDWVGSVQ